MIEIFINVGKCNHQEIPLFNVFLSLIRRAESEWGKLKYLNLFLPINLEVLKIYSVKQHIKIISNNNTNYNLLNAYYAKHITCQSYLI